ncbi:MAG: DoxX family protein [Kiritimatiellales bacterium]|nr:DoxX family protein [Kiritimatiellales bacterium]
MKKSNSENLSAMSRLQMMLLVVLRMVIGWHFLYEGISKLYTPGWTAAGFLTLSRWAFSGFFHWIVENSQVLAVADFMVTWGLVLIGLGLIVGLLSRVASVAGILLLLMFYVANPPLIGMDFGVIREGNYLVVDKNTVEMFALAVLAIFPTGKYLGLDRLFSVLRSQKKTAVPAAAPDTAPAKAMPTHSVMRRELLMNMASFPVLGAFIYAVMKKRGWGSHEEKYLMAKPAPKGGATAKGKKVDVVTSATMKTFNFSSLNDLKGQVPKAKIGDLEISRMIMGGNLIGGWAHARDLIYVSSLVKQYHTDKKVFETFMLAEKCGINTFLTSPLLARVINKYWRNKLGNIQFISDCGGKGDLLEIVKFSIDSGAAACYVQGGVADKLVRQGKIDEIAKAVDLIQQNGLPGGCGAHDINTVKAVVDAGIKPDFWMKTLHHHNYWSCNTENQKDNVWCHDPKETIRYMETLEQPWIAFKTLAAGAIKPQQGFKYAFENGADFICVGMYDFQMVDDVNIGLDVLAGNLKRQRPWRAETIAETSSLA